jgi:4-hydroxy 2-oxovalerate aldolase
MEALDLNRYSLTTIVNNIKSKNEIQAPELKLDTAYKSCLIVGGGISVKKHQQAIIDFLNFNKNLLVIHATSKYIDEFQSISNTQFSVISGDELLKFDEIPSNIHSFILGSNSLFVDTYRDNGNFYTLNDLSFTEQNQDSPFSISLQIALNIDSKKIFLVGFDGYEELKNKKELYLMKENQQIIDSFVKKQELNSLTPTKYSHVKKSSVYEKSLLCI